MSRDKRWFGNGNTRLEMAAPASCRVEEDRLLLASKTGLKLSKLAADFCATNYMPVASFEGPFDPVETRKTMSQGLVYDAFREGTPARVLNMYKLGTDVCVRTTREFAAGEVLAMLGPVGCAHGETLPAAETFHMETQARPGGVLVWSPEKSPSAQSSIGSYVVDCHTFGMVVNELAEANIDYHTAVFTFGTLHVPVPILVANRKIPSGGLLVGDFGDTFFLEPRYMVPNVAALVADSASRKRKRDAIEENAKSAFTFNQDAASRLAVSDDELYSLRKRHKALERRVERVNELEEQVAVLVNQANAERLSKEFSINEAHRINKLLAQEQARVNEQFAMIRRLQQQNVSLVKQNQSLNFNP